MSKQFPKLLAISILCMSILMNVVVSVQAQDSGPTPTPIATIVATSQPVAIANLNLVTFNELRQTEIQLIGPFDSTAFSFALPANWEISAGAQLNLSMGVSFNTTIQNQSDISRVGGGILSVLFNDTLLATIPLNEVGEIERNLQIPVEAFTSRRSDGRMDLTINLDSRFACYRNDGNDQVSVFIHSKSYFTLPHKLIKPNTSLVNFPRPIFQNSFNVDAALLVIPEQPTAAELQAALTVGASLGNITGNTLILDMTTPSKLTAEQTANTNLILVGNAASLPVLAELKLPEPVSGGQFQIVGSSPDDGVIQMINSPWSDARVILVISGNTDRGTIKAAQAIGSSVLLTSRFQNIAVIQKVQTSSVSTVQPTDQTLADLGYPGRLFENRGVDTAPYRFYIPPGMTVTSDAYFLLVFGHSSLINFDRSGISVVLNGSPIGSIRPSDTTASQATNRVKITIPSSAIVPGNNLLEVKANIIPIDYCTPPNLAGLWINLWPESTLHLPLTPATVNPVTKLDLATYSNPFVYDPMLGNTAFVLERNDLESWRGALQIAALLGSRANGPIAALNAYYVDGLPEVERSKYNLLIIGRPSQMPIMSDVNKSLPVPFLDGGDIVGESNFQVTYRIPSDSPLGYLEMMASPWNPDNAVLAVLGNKAQGVNWAISSLIVPTLRAKLAGNFAVINDTQIITSDTRLTPTVNIGSTQAPEVVAVPPNTETTSPMIQQPAWVLPAFVISLVLIISILVFVVVGSLSRNRARSSSERGSRNFGDQGFFGSIKDRILTFLKELQNRRKDG